jgi:hypothetical protein
MRPIAFAALICCLATPSLAQTLAVAEPAPTVQAAGLTIKDGSDAGPATQPVLPDRAEAEDVNNVTDLPRIATHAPTPLGRPVPSGDSQ